MSLSDNSTSTSTSSLADECHRDSLVNPQLGLRIAAIFILLVTSILGTLFPVLTRNSKLVSVRSWVYEGAKYFGSGVILATALIHLMAPATEALTSPCLPSGWSTYPFAEGITLTSIFVVFIIEIMAIRIGTSRLAALGLKHYGHGAHGPQAEPIPSPGDNVLPSAVKPDLHTKVTITEGTLENNSITTPTCFLSAEVGAKLIGAVILELGVIFHSMVIGLTLAVNEEFTTFFLVIIFHQMFEGLGLGARLSQLSLPERYRRLPLFASLLYSFITPFGMAIGLSVRNSYNPNSATALIVSGCLDAFSAGILLYTGLVELLAHDFLFNEKLLLEHSNKKLILEIGAVMSGAGIMALLGRWA